MKSPTFISPCLPFRSFRRMAPKISACSKSPPIIVADVLSTLVRDPFFHGMSSYFGFETFESFLSAKTPNLWVDFELGKVDEQQIADNFFKDRTPIDVPLLKRFLKDSYELLPGVSDMLTALQDSKVDVHLCTNYPVWAHLIEDALQLSTRFGVHWTFISAIEGIRKPEREAYLRVAKNANVDPSHCIMLDDRAENCKGALEAGFLAAITFENASQAGHELRELYLKSNTPLKL